MKFLKEKSLNHIIYYMGLLLTALLFVLAKLQGKEIFKLNQLLPTCFFYSLTHIPCPSCGMTRAVEAAFCFDFIASFRYHPLVLYLFIVFAIYMIWNTLELFSNHKTSTCYNHGFRFHVGYVYLGIAILLIQWIVKLLIAFI